MKTEDIHKALDEITAELVERAIPRARVELLLHNGDKTELHLWGENIDPKGGVGELWSVYGPAPIEEKLASGLAYARSLPTQQDRELEAFMHELGRLIDKGRASGIGVDFMNPLVETMKRLSENALEHKREAANDG